MWLALDASTYTASLALLDGDTVVWEGQAPMRAPDGDQLTPAVVDAVERHGGWGRLERVFVGGGPGSFTSLRIAAALAKGIVTARGIQLWAGSSLALVAADPRPGDGHVTVAMDALRGEVFVQEFTRRDGQLVASMAGWTRIPRGDLPVGEAQRLRVVELAGDDGPRARYAAVLASAGMAGPVDIPLWEPDYGRLAEAQVRWEAAHGRPLVGEGRSDAGNP